MPFGQSNGQQRHIGSPEDREEVESSGQDRVQARTKSETEASEIGASTNRLHSPRQIHRGKAAIKMTTQLTPRGMHYVSCWVK